MQKSIEAIKLIQDGGNAGIRFTITKENKIVFINV